MEKKNEDLRENLLKEVKRIFKKSRGGDEEIREEYFKSCEKLIDFIAENTGVQYFRNINSRHIDKYEIYMKKEGYSEKMIENEFDGIQFAHERSGSEKSKYADKTPIKQFETSYEGSFSIPRACIYCGGTVELISNELVYGKIYGNGLCYKCSHCDSYVGVHPDLVTPLGILANKELRGLRKDAHALFDPMWRNGAMTRTEAYTKLSKMLKIPKSKCHISWFDKSMILKVIDLLKEKDKMQVGTEKARCCRCGEDVVYNIRINKVKFFKSVEVNVEEKTGVCSLCNKDIYIPALEKGNTRKIQEKYVELKVC